MRGMTMDEVEERVHVSAQEILDAIGAANPLLVQATAEHLQNQKMKAVLSEIVDTGDDPEED